MTGLNEMIENEVKRNTVNRLGMFDLVKGILMVIIIAGHSVTDYFHYWEYDIRSDILVGSFFSLLSVVMYGIIPMFFMICGYGFRKKTMGKAIKGQIKYFWKPYLIVTIATALLVIAKKIMISGSIAEGLRYQVLPYLLAFCPGDRFFTGIYMGSIGPIWFFWVFVTAGILLNAVLQEEQYWIQLCLVIILACTGLMLRNVTLPWCIQQTLICGGYMYIGWLMKKLKILEKKLPLYLIFLIALLSAATVLRGGSLEVSQNVYTNGADDLLVSCLAGVILVFGAVKINYFNGRVSDGLRWVGKNAMYICCIHTVSYTVVPWKHLAEYLENVKPVGAAAEMLLQFVIAFGGCLMIERFQGWKRKVKAKAV